MARKYFGTDGIRGCVGDAPITVDFVLKLGWASGVMLSRYAKGNRRVLIGKDTRVSGYMFESALEAGLIAAGVDVLMLGPMPTPAIAYLTRAFRASAGIVISASHNPFGDNGIKFFAGDGYKLPDSIEEEMEILLDQPVITNRSENLGKATRVPDAAGRYIEFCKGTLPCGFNLNGMNIALDCANGATYDVGPKVFTELGAHVTVIGNTPDGFNINHECGSTHMDGLREAVVRQKADLGIAFDGDGDRVLFVDSAGEVVDGDEILFIIASHRQQNLGGCNGVAGTLMTNLGMELALKEQGIPFTRTKVGDRYVVEAMRNQGYNVGGEQSGHVVLSDFNTTGDGLIAALQVLAVLVQSGQTVSEICSMFDPVPQVLKNVRYAGGQPLETDAVKKAIAAAQEKLGNSGRLVIRKSGTEPLIRVMAEGDDEKLVSLVVGDIAEAIRGAAGTE